MCLFAGTAGSIFFLVVHLAIHLHFKEGSYDAVGTQNLKSSPLSDGKIVFTPH